MNEQSQLRQQIIDCAIAMSTSGLSPGRSGNVSARFKDGFLITPSGLAYTDLSIKDIVYIDGDGKSIGNDRFPSSEWRFHYDIYDNYRETGGIVHCHSRHATALACCNAQIPAFHYMVAAAGGKNIPIAPYALFGTQDLSDHVVKALDGCKASLMEHHGLVALGDDVSGALDLAHEVEELAAQYVLVRSLGGDQILNDEQMDEVIERFKTYGKQDSL
ncbi:MAG: class II aldolase [bacterium]|nr:class II aldolase [bacterium]